MDTEDTDIICKWFDELRNEINETFDKSVQRDMAIRESVSSIRDDLYQLQKLVTDRRTDEEKQREHVISVSDVKLNSTYDKDIEKEYETTPVTFGNKDYLKLGPKGEIHLDYNLTEEGKRFFEKIEKEMKDKGCCFSPLHDPVKNFIPGTTNPTAAEILQAIEKQTNEKVSRDDVISEMHRRREQVMNSLYGLEQHPCSTELRLTMDLYQDTKKASKKLGISFDDFIRMAINMQVNQINKMEGDLKKAKC